MAWVAIMLLTAGCATAAAQSTSSTAIRSAGTGDDTWVLVSGLMGGVAGFRALETELLRDGVRVVTIDPYRLSVDSLDVSYVALARRVVAALDEQGVQHAKVVGHANGAGVALRIAAYAPDRVTSLYFLDAGALAVSHGKVLGQSLRLVPLLARLPGGKDYLRTRFVAGVRKNSVNNEWFDAAAQKAYVDPILAGIGRAVALAIRLGATQEGDSLSTVVARIGIPVTIILGDAPHPSSAGTAEIDALRPLGARLRVIRLSGVGHFPHEEATAAVAQLLRKGEHELAPRVRR